MSFYHETQSTQTNEQPELSIQQIDNSHQFYSKRYNLEIIRSKLYELVPEDEYWDTFSQFVFGFCTKKRFDEVTSLYLRTNQSKLLHNCLIRAVLFNSHFSLIPPPSIPITRKKKIDHTSTFKSLHRASRYQNLPLQAVNANYVSPKAKLSERVRKILSIASMKDLTVDEEAVSLISNQVASLILNILRKTINLYLKNPIDRTDTTISLDQLIQTVLTQINASEVLSPNLLQKISFLSSCSQTSADSYK